MSSQLNVQSEVIGPALEAAGWSIIRRTRDGCWLLASHGDHPGLELEPYSEGSTHGVAIRRPDAMLQLRGKAVQRRSDEVSALFECASVVPPGVPVLRASILSAANTRPKSPIHRYYLGPFESGR